MLVICIYIYTYIHIDIIYTYTNIYDLKKKYIYILFAQTVSDIDRHSLQPVAYDVKLIVIAGSSWAGSSTE